MQDGHFESPQANKEDEGGQLETAEKGEEVFDGQMGLFVVKENLKLINVGLYDSLGEEND